MRERGRIETQLDLRLAGLRMGLASLRLRLALKAGFRPDQPRHPRGHPDGGQWTRLPGHAQVHRVGRRRAGGGEVRIGGRWLPVTPAQQARLAQSYREMQSALREAQRIDPTWKPPAQSYATVEGLIRANRNIEAEARRRIFESLDTGAGVGPFAREWIAAPATNRRLNRQERQEINRIGRRWGCHRCGRVDPGTKSGNFIGDHQVPVSIGRSSRIYPHCLWCSAAQGGLLSQYFMRLLP